MIDQWLAAQVPDHRGLEDGRRPDWSDYVLGPRIILMGCQAWPPRVDPGRGCPVCDRGIHAGDDGYYCAVCDSLSPRREAQVRAARIGLRRRDRVEQAESKAKARMTRVPVLTESDRRKLWNGYRGTFLQEWVGELTNVAKVGRDWLIAIGQEPDWDLILDGRGNVIGRFGG